MSDEEINNTIRNDRNKNYRMKKNTTISIFIIVVTAIVLILVIPTSIYFSSK